MSDPQVLKPDKDYKPILDERFPQLEELAATDLEGAVEQLTLLEKQTRQASDMNSTARILVEICELCKKQSNLAMLNEQIQVLSKKHGQLKGAITKMVQRCVEMLGEIDAETDKLELIETLRKVTDGKIYVEAERARVTRTLAKIKEEKGEVKEAQEVLTSIQVETFGSMSRHEKIEFILEQVRLTLALDDYQLAHILARKISTKVLEEENFFHLKISYYALMTRIGMHNDAYLDLARYNHHILSTPFVEKDESRWQAALSAVVLFIILAPYDNEQSDLLHRVAADKRLAELPIYAELIKCFTTPELMRWPKIDEYYGARLRATPVFTASDPHGVIRWNALKTRVIEHNIRVVSAYYARITLPRLQQLLDLTAEETEKQLSALVSNKSVHARIDRPAQLVVFGKPKKADEVLKAWSFDVGKLLSGIEKVRQLVQKEYTLKTVQQSS